MKVASQAAVTPSGVRDGDPAALAGLVARRGPAVLAFCGAVCEPDVVPHAAAEAFARFRAAVAAADDPAQLNPEVLLLGATRHAAASLARTNTGGGRLSRRSRGPSEACLAVPALLAARAEDMLGPAELDDLAAHLDGCAGCQEVEAAFRRAERAYRHPPDHPVDAAVTEEILAAAVAAAPVLDVYAQHEPSPEPEALAEPQPAEPSAGPGAVSDPGGTPVEEAPDPEPVPAGGHHTEDEDAYADEDAFGDEPDEDAYAYEPDDEDPHADQHGADEPSDHDLGGDDADHLDPQTAAPQRDEVTAPVTVVASHLPTAAGTGGLPRTRRHLHLPHLHAGDHGALYRYVLPGAALALAVIVILAIAGVIGGDDPAPSSSRPAAAYLPGS